ncbi:hypothetical protein [Nocardia araoensis]|uniref:hypothetical protein n=1 Tax=Nocardia araoensis TaxID=228600 RepID=UPI0012F68B96|nr:hypothetical protein [Nocardia araoensis]
MPLISYAESLPNPPDRNTETQTGSNRREKKTLMQPLNRYGPDPNDLEATEIIGTPDTDTAAADVTELLSTSDSGTADRPATMLLRTPENVIAGPGRSRSAGDDDDAGDGLCDERFRPSDSSRWHQYAGCFNLLRSPRLKARDLRRHLPCAAAAVALIALLTGCVLATDSRRNDHVDAAMAPSEVSVRSNTGDPTRQIGTIAGDVDGTSGALSDVPIASDTATDIAGSETDTTIDTTSSESAEATDTTTSEPNTDTSPTAPVCRSA